MTNFSYTIPNTFLLLRSDNPLPSPFFLVLDKKIPRKTKLEKLFFNAHKSFRARLRDLSNLKLATTQRDADAMRILLESLVQAKHQIKKERSE